jgi:hypothetical protein
MARLSTAVIVAAMLFMVGQPVRGRLLPMRTAQRAWMHASSIHVFLRN